MKILLCSIIIAMQWIHMQTGSDCNGSPVHLEYKRICMRLESIYGQVTLKKFRWILHLSLQLIYN